MHLYSFKHLFVTKMVKEETINLGYKEIWRGRRHRERRGRERGSGERQRVMIKYI